MKRSSLLLQNSPHFIQEAASILCGEEITKLDIIIVPNTFVAEELAKHIPDSIKPIIHTIGQLPKLTPIRHRALDKISKQLLIRQTLHKLIQENKLELGYNSSLLNATEQFLDEIAEYNITSHNIHKIPLNTNMAKQWQSQLNLAYLILSYWEQETKQIDAINDIEYRNKIIEQYTDAITHNKITSAILGLSGRNPATKKLMEQAILSNNTTIILHKKPPLNQSALSLLRTQKSITPRQNNPRITIVEKSLPPQEQDQIIDIIQQNKTKNMAIVIPDRRMQHNVITLLQAQDIHIRHKANILHEINTALFSSIMQFITSGYETRIALSIINSKLCLALQEHCKAIQQFNSLILPNISLTQNIFNISPEIFQQHSVSMEFLHTLKEIFSGIISQSKYLALHQIWSEHKNIMHKLTLPTQEQDSSLEQFITKIDNRIKDNSMRISINDYNTLITSQLNSFTVEVNTQSNIKILQPTNIGLSSFDIVLLADFTRHSWPITTKENNLINNQIRCALGINPANENINEQEFALHNILQNNNTIITYNTHEKQISSMITIAQAFKPLHQRQVPKPSTSTPKNNLQLTYNQTAPKQINRTLSITAICTLIMDPFMFYAKYILKLNPKDTIQIDAHKRKYGIIVHEMLEIYSKNPKINISELLKHIEQKLEQSTSRTYSLASDKYHSTSVLTQYAKHSQAHHTCSAYSEANTTITMPSPQGDVRIIGRIDRLEIEDQKIKVIDYKTGSVPTKKEVLTGLKPQLSLLALMVRDGTVTCSNTNTPINIPKTQSANIECEYWDLKPKRTAPLQTTHLNISSIPMDNQFLDHIKIELQELINTLYSEHMNFSPQKFASKSNAGNEYEMLSGVYV